MNDGRLPGGGAKSSDAMKAFEFERRKILEQTKNIIAALDGFTDARDFSSEDRKKIKTKFQKYCQSLINKVENVGESSQNLLEVDITGLCNALAELEEFAVGMIDAFVKGKQSIDCENISLLSTSMLILIGAGKNLAAIRLEMGKSILKRDYAPRR
jgi:hypothetical protein